MLLKTCSKVAGSQTFNVAEVSILTSAVTRKDAGMKAKFFSKEKDTDVVAVKQKLYVLTDNNTEIVTSSIDNIIDVCPDIIRFVTTRGSSYDLHFSKEDGKLLKDLYNSVVTGNDMCIVSKIRHMSSYQTLTSAIC